jgi:hypothetical protein
MSFYQNLDYAIVQVAHNFGAVAVVGGSLAAIRFRGVSIRIELARIVLAGWVTQGVSGAALGAVSFYYYHQFPDIAGIALAALVIKMFCAVFGIALMVTYLFKSDDWTVIRIDSVWAVASVFSVIAMSSAAFLRWFS